MDIYNQIKAGIYAVSQSRLKRLIGNDYNPQYFLSDMSSDPGEAQTIGLAYECLLVEPETFDDKFYVTSGTRRVTTGSKAVLTHLIEGLPHIESLHDLETLPSIEADIKVREIADKLGILKTTPFEGMFNYVLNYRDNLVYAKEFLKFKRDSVDKIPLTEKEHEKVKKMISNTHANKFTKALLEPEGIVYDQYLLLWDISGIKCKGILDRIIINHDDKTVQIIDFKSGKDAFLKSYESFRLDIQLAFYFYGVKENFPDYKVFNPIFLHACTTGNLKVTLWQMSDKDLHIALYGTSIHKEFTTYEDSIIECPNNRLTTRIEGVMQLLNKYNYHAVNNTWTYPVGFDTEKGLKQINLWN